MLKGKIVGRCQTERIWGGWRTQEGGNFARSAAGLTGDVHTNSIMGLQNKTCVRRGSLVLCWTCNGGPAAAPVASKIVVRFRQRWGWPASSLAG